MAIFNPGPAPIEPKEFLKQFHPIEQPIADKSFGELLKGTGDLIEGAVKFADATTKKEIDTGLHQAIDQEQATYEAQLDATKAAVTGQKTASTDIITAPTADNVPPALKGVGKTAEVLTSARANGAISETDYIARLDSLAKDFRARYPGYRDYIDERISNTTGMKPANALITSKIRDIDSFITKSNSALEKAKSELYTHFGSAPNGPELMARLNAGDTSAINEVARAIYPQMRTEAQLRLKHAIREDEKGDKALEAGRVESASVQYGNETASNNLNNLTLADKTKVTDFINDFNTGKITATSEQWGPIQQSIVASMQATEAQVRKTLNTPIPGDPTGRSSAAIMGPTKTDEVVKQSIAWHNSVLESVKSNDIGTAHMTTRIADAMSRDLMLGVLKKDEMIRLLAAYNKISPNFAASMVDPILKAGVSPLTKAELQADVAMFAKQPHLITGIVDQHTGIPYTFSKALDGINKNPDLNVPGAASQKAEAVKLTLDSIDTIKKPGTPDDVKIGFIKAAFSRENLDLLTKIEPDTYKAGRRIPGQYSVFNNFMSYEIGKEVKRLSDSGRPELFGEWKNWGETTFSKILFPRDITILKEAPLDKNIEVVYIDVNHAFELRSTAPALLPSARTSTQIGQNAAAAQSARNLEEAQRAVYRLNSGIASIANVVKVGGGDEKAIDAYVFQLLRGHKDAFDPVSTPGQMLQAIIKSRKPKEAPK